MINSAYNALNGAEREAVDAFVESARLYAARNNELVIHALSRPIPADVIARSRGQLEKPLVIAGIYEKINELSQQQDLSGRRILREHLNIAMSNIGDYLQFDEYGTPKLNLHNCTREQLSAVKSVKISQGMFGVTTTFELHSKQAHLEALTKMMGLDSADNSTYLEHIATPKNIKPLPQDVDQKDAEKAYTNLLEAIK